MNHSRNQIFRGKITEPADDSRPVPIEGRAGTAIFMHGMTPHASTVNSSMHPWRTLILSYHAADAFLIYVGEMTVKNEMHARLVQGEQTSFPRFSTIAVPVPKYPVRSRHFTNSRNFPLTTALSKEPCDSGLTPPGSLRRELEAK